jgi:hypothetical protein
VVVARLQGAITVLTCSGRRHVIDGSSSTLAQEVGDSASEDLYRSANLDVPP